MKQNNYTAKDIERYHSGQLSSAEMHALEKAALDDLFLADALEGYQHTQTATGDLTSLQQKLHARIQNEDKRKIFFVGNNWMKIAALFILFAGGGWLVFQTFSGDDKQPELATIPATQKQAPVPSTQGPTEQMAADSSQVSLDMTANGQTVSKQANEKKDVRSNTNLTVATTPLQVQTSPSTLSTQVTDSVKEQVYAHAEITAPTSDKTSESRLSKEAYYKKQDAISGKVSGFVDTIKNFDVVLQPAPMAEVEVVVVNKNKTVARQDARRRMHITVDTLEPVEGWTNFGDYIAANMRAPEELETKPVKGEVELSFEVNKQGEPVNITVVRSLCGKCDEEAIRLLKEGPRWKKNKKKGKVKFNF